VRGSRYVISDASEGNLAKPGRFCSEPNGGGGDLRGGIIVVGWGCVGRKFLIPLRGTATKQKCAGAKKYWFRSRLFFQSDAWGIRGGEDFLKGKKGTIKVGLR